MAAKKNTVNNDVDISEDFLRAKYPEAFEMLLHDHTTHENIFWATDSYADRGDGYRFEDYITAERITGENGRLIQPRVVKSKAEQTQRAKDKAEVFTPTWICNAQNNLVDEAWFGHKDVFNKEVIDADGNHTWIPSPDPIEFSETPGKTWRDYVRDVRMEITCGEAPYIVSRYDATTGIPFKDLRMRVGILDRKLRVIKENALCKEEWLDLVLEAFQSVYGFEWQGDNLLLARENLLYTFIDYYKDYYGKLPSQPKTLKFMAYIISWNIWQMDGLKFGLPGHDPKEDLEPNKKKESDDRQGLLDFGFEDEPSDSIVIGPRERFCRIKDWVYNRRLTKYAQNPKVKQLLGQELYKIPFIQIVNKTTK